EGWMVLTRRWTGFFVFLAVLNEAVWRTQTTDLWVSFKVFAILPLTIGFLLLQMPLLRRHLPPDFGQESNQETGQDPKSDL
ncbi:MAG: septation protein IspZ, partial [Pseudomonadota bacterium]|nr:septation protein IspZ [Pseudomonadota bacterium]